MILWMKVGILQYQPFNKIGVYIDFVKLDTLGIPNLVHYRAAQNYRKICLLTKGNVGMTLNHRTLASRAYFSTTYTKD